MMNAISIIMPCYNREHDLLRVLEAYDNQDCRESFELIAIDDASLDQTYRILSSYCPRHYNLRIERHTHNRGPAAARNLGISVAQAPLILFVGDDILPAPDFVRRHIEAHQFRLDQTIAILGHTAWPSDITINTLMIYIDGKGAKQFSYYYMKDGHEYDFRHFYTSNISLKTNFLKSQPVWFDTDFHLAAFEDVELGYRLSRKGLRIIYSNKPMAYHYHYHTIWTFSKRQYNAGLMACILLKKHPELFPLIKSPRWTLRLAMWWVQLVMYNLCKRYTTNPEEIERQILSFISMYETEWNYDATGLYHRVLTYFYWKGLIYGSFQDKIARNLHSNCARQLALSFRRNMVRLGIGDFRQLQNQTNI